MNITNIIALVLGLGFIIMGFSRVEAAGFSFTGMDMDQVRQYSLYMAVGMFFGWALFIGISNLLNWSSATAPVSMLAIALVSPILYLVVIHQTKHTFNDGPATMALGAVLILSSLLTAILEKRKSG